jgi:phenylacetate-CoA ligase
LDFNPDWLELQPSIAYLLAQIAKENCFPIPSNLKYIELNGELLSNEYRQAIKEVFNIEPVNVYGTNETNIIAMEYDDKKLRIMEDNVIVEVIKDGKPIIGEEGEIYVTSLSNYAMPFIRYRTGDIGIINHENSVDVLDVISGRTIDFIILANGEKLNSYVLFGIIQYTNEYMQNAIKQFQIIQKDINEFDVILALKDGYKNWESAVKEKFIENINEEELKKANWNFNFADHILPDPKTGKTKYFISLKHNKF